MLAVAQHLQAQCVTDERFNQFAEYMIFRMSRKIYIIRDKQFVFLLSVTIDNILAKTCKKQHFWDKILAMDMFDFLEATPDEINKGIAARVRTVRKRRKISQVRLSEKSGVSLGSVKRFESTGEISLLSLTKIAIALNVEQELKQLFSNVPYMSLEEIENERNQQD